MCAVPIASCLHNLERLPAPNTPLGTRGTQALSHLCLGWVWDRSSLRGRGGFEMQRAANVGAAQ